MKNRIVKFSFVNLALGIFLTIGSFYQTPADADAMTFFTTGISIYKMVYGLGVALILVSAILFAVAISMGEK